MVCRAFHHGVPNRASRLIAIAAWIVLLATVISQPGILRAQVPATSAAEYDLKLARLYSTLRYITWPDDANAPLVIGVIEPNPFGNRLEKLVGRKPKNRPIQVQSITNAQNMRPCQVLFIPSDAPPDLVNEVLQRTANQPVLVWRDQPTPNGNGGATCTFVREGETLLIEADPAEFKRRNLTPDGQLLSLNIVRIVKTNK